MFEHGIGSTTFGVIMDKAFEGPSKAWQEAREAWLQAATAGPVAIFSTIDAVIESTGVARRTAVSAFWELVADHRLSFDGSPRSWLIPERTTSLPADVL